MELKLKDRIKIIDLAVRVMQIKREYTEGYYPSLNDCYNEILTLITTDREDAKEVK